MTYLQLRIQVFWDVTLSVGEIPDILKHRGAFILNCLILEEEGVITLWKEKKEPTDDTSIDKLRGYTVRQMM